MQKIRALRIILLFTCLALLASCSRQAQRHYKIARWYHNKGLINEAIIEYKQAIKLKPDFYQAHHGLALAYTKKGWYDYALKEAELAFDIYPTDELYNLIQLIKEKKILEPIVSDTQK